ncbi:MAG TPA: ion transporter [Chitinophagales bacterium]|jgi:voltage-gated potassium channel|nr:ion transporter [Chitinophagales bacterium]
MQEVKPDHINNTTPSQVHEGWRGKLYHIIFESDTRSGKIFDLALVTLILSNIIVILLESVHAIDAKYHSIFRTLQLVYTFLFTIEYLLRLLCVKKSYEYAKSFYGVVDLFSILPSYIELLIPHTHFLMLIRIFRLLRIFRIFKMLRYLNESRLLLYSLITNYRRIIVFLSFVLFLAVFLGSLMYVFESENNPGFSSIPQSIYWSIVTITTVGYGDVAPQSILGKLLASFIMILGYSIIVVSTGIVSMNALKNWNHENQDSQVRCKNCLLEGHEHDAKYCRSCGTELEK